MSIDQAKRMLEFFPALAVWEPKLIVRGHQLTGEQAWNVIRRIAGYAMPGAGDCIVWGGGKTPDGYGRINLFFDGERHATYTHRVSWQLANGGIAIPADKEIDHRCDCPECFSPAHVRSMPLRNNRQRAAWNTNVKRRQAARAGTEEMY